jgi:hypothetical protein
MMLLSSLKLKRIWVKLNKRSFYGDTKKEVTKTTQEILVADPLFN